MASTATYLGDISWLCPTTKHFRCDDGRHLLITVKGNIPPAPELVNLTTGLSVPIAVSQIPKGTEVFLADENAVVLDADGEPANGLTPLAQFEDGTSFEAALAQLGYPEVR
jgi:hypothetical protein